LIQIIRIRATPKQIEDMLQELKFYIKVAVDLERQVLAGGGEMHFYCEQALLEDGSQQQDIWAASFMPETHKIIYESMVNLRPKQNRSMEIQDAKIKKQVAHIIMEFLG
jgi:pyruvate/oxaloacetate carboxyltransferase